MNNPLAPGDPEKPWRDTYKRLVALDREWEKPRFRKAAIAELHRFLSERCAHVPHLGDLVRLVRESMTRQDLFALMVPCERELKRVKVTDVEILSQDLQAPSPAAPKLPLTVIADNFRSAINVGTLFRVSDCFGIEEALLCGYTPDPSDGRAKAAALGAENWVPWRRFPRTLDAVRAVQARNLPVRFRKAAIAELHRFLSERCAHVPHLGDLVRLVRESMTRQDLFALMVPCERELKRVKVTDVEILSQDLQAPSPAAPKLPLTVIADNFRSAINVGTLFRVSDCFGIEEALLCGYTPDPSDGRAKAAALGAENWVPWRRFPRTLDAVRAVQARNLPVIALETVEGAPTLEQWKWSFPCAIALGSERFGLDAEVIQACDGVMRIPMYGRKNSLNVVMAFTLVAHAARQAFQASGATSSL